MSSNLFSWTNFTNNFYNKKPVNKDDWRINKASLNND
jgi:hypothetical protein